MNKKEPWDDESTPLCDASTFNIRDENGDDNTCIGVGFACDLERRLRHAWKLVNSLRIDAMNDELDCECTEQRLSDIEETLQ